jgi:hypothetical protein
LDSRVAFALAAMTIPNPSSELPPTPGPPWSDVISSALAFWEPRRVLYNLVLVAVVLVQTAGEGRLLLDSVTFPTFLSLFIMAVLANLCYSTAYLPDTFIQLSRFRDRWLRWRWGLWLLGTAFAAAIAYLLTSGGIASSAG